MYFREEDYKDKYIYNYNKDYFSDRLVKSFSAVNFKAVNFALSSQETKKEVNCKQCKGVFLSNN